MYSRRNIIYSTSIALAMIAFANTFGQSNRPSKPAVSEEEIQLLSDRELYCVSENIYFSAHYYKPLSIGEEELSTVLYAELIRWDGTKLANSKVRIINSIAHGSLSIPENIPSGVYYIRAYTKWMRNYSPYHYCYHMVKIINPNIRDIDKGPDKEGIGIRFKELKYLNAEDEIVISGIKNSYKSKELVEFNIVITDDRFSGPYTLSVSRSGSTDVEKGSGIFDLQDISKSKDDIEFLPENKYLSISGKVLNENSKTPLAYRQVILSSTLDPFYLSVSTSKRDGDFLFLMPEYLGSHQFCISSTGEDSSGIEFLIDNDFCSQPLSLPYFQFELTPEEKILAKEICINAQLNNKFNPPEQINYNWIDIYPFYGIAPEIIYIKDYIELVDLREFIFELVPNVYVDKVDGKWILKLTRISSSSAFPPLILLDNIPVQNNEKLLGISTREIDRIEVVNGGYIIGKNMFSGIISIFSNKRDLAGMELNNNHQYFNLQLIQNNNYNPFLENSPTIPGNTEMLNLLYWNPALEISNKNSTKIKFFSSDAPGKYTVTMRSIGGNNNIIYYQQSEFTVE